MSRNWQHFAEWGKSPLPSQKENPVGSSSSKAVNIETEVDPKVIIPDYYGGREDPYEVFKVVRAWGSSFFIGTALKYLRRAGKKDPAKRIEDLEKAQEYIRGEIESVKLEHGLS